MQGEGRRKDGQADQSAPSGQTCGKCFDLLITPIYPRSSLKGKPLWASWAPGIPEPKARPAHWKPGEWTPLDCDLRTWRGKREVAASCRGQSRDIRGASVLRGLPLWELWRQAVGRGREKLGLRDLPSATAGHSFFVPRAVPINPGLYSPNAHFTALETEAHRSDVSHTRHSDVDPGSHRLHY